LRAICQSVAYLHREELRAEGKSEEEVKEDIAQGYKGGRFKVPGPGFLYMISNENYVYDDQSKKSGIVPPHVMFYAPKRPRKTWDMNRYRPQWCPIFGVAFVGDLVP
jgi:hypothetical protein